METCFNYTTETAYFSSDEKKWCNKIEKLAMQHPEDVKIIRRPKDNDGCIYAKLPSSWLRIQPKTARTYTDEQLARLKEQLAKANEKRAQATEV